MKILTFVIPAYNSARFLDKCVTSMLLPEILEKLEILVVNDGSTDETVSIAQKYTAQYPQVVRLISQENKGHGGALNTGCAQAQGKYLKVIDADDWVETENLPAFLSLLEGCDSDVVLTHYHTIDISTGEIKNWRSYPGAFGRAYDFGHIMADWRSFDRSLTFHGITYRTDFYRKYGISLSEHVFYEDHEYATFPCCHAETVTPFDLFVYDYRIGDVAQSVSNANQLKRLGHTETVIRKMVREYRKLPENPGKRYAAMKTQALLLSYLTTSLLVQPDKKTGRRDAAQRMAECRADAPEIAAMAQRKYRIFLAMNHLHLGKKLWDRILGSRLYNTLRRNHSFE